MIPYPLGQKSGAVGYKKRVKNGPKGFFFTGFFRVLKTAVLSRVRVISVLFYSSLERKHTCAKRTRV
jgi:hypothetical protein